MPSNRWSHLRKRIPRPIVCKSSDPYKGWPHTLVINADWNYGDGANFSTIEIIQARLLRLPNTCHYIGLGVDVETQNVILDAYLPRADGTPAVKAALVATVFFLSGFIGNGIGFAPAWLFGENFTSLGDPITWTTIGQNGSWRYEVDAF